MGKVRTSASFYRRGVPNSYSTFGLIAQSNFTVVNPINKFIASTNFFGAICSVFTIMFMKYRNLFVGGHSMMAIGLLTCAISCKLTIYGVIVGLCIFCFGF